MTAVPFPIICLPQRAFQKSVRQMSSVEQLSLSILSENISKLIERLHKSSRISDISVTLPMGFNLDLHLLQDLNFDFTPDQMNLKMSNQMFANNVVQYTKQHVPGFTLKQLFEQAMRVFIQNQQVHLYCPPESSIKEISGYIKKLRITGLEVESSEIRNCQLLELFPALEKLSASGAPICKSMLTSNFEQLKLTSTKVTLDDIILSNCSAFFTVQNFSDKELNILMKHWIRGCIPRLRYFDFHTRVFEPDQLDETRFFKGIEYKVVASFVGGGGYFEIEKYDGRKATVIFFKNSSASSFRFFEESSSFNMLSLL